MTIEQLEIKLKEIDENLFVKDLSEYKVMDRVEIRWKDPNGNSESICACPRDVKEEKDENFKDEYGTTHRSLGEVIDICRGFIGRIKEDPEFLADVMNKEV